jgi:TolA-binding protein
MRKLASLTLSLFLLTGTAYADSPKDSPKDATATTAKTAEAKAASKSNAEIAAEMEELRQALQAQQEQLQMLKEELAKRDRQIEEAREAAATANSRATEASTKATEAATTSAEVKSTATALNTTVANMAASNAAAVNSAAIATSGKPGKDEEKGPTTIRFKGVNITPGGFIEAATVTRQRAESADINTNFNAIPYPNNALGKLTETNFSARQSRLTLLIDGKVGETKLTGYYEADFLGAGTTSNNRQSNSYVFRQRQLWGRADFANGFAFSAGQMWSLATENRKGIVNRNEWFPLMIDPQYVVGFTWQRADAVRVTKSFGDKFSVGVSAEGSQATVGGRGFSTYTAVNGTVSQNSFVFAPGNGGGLYNAFDPTGYSVNKTPDFVFKAALDPGWGHYEVFGIVSTFRNRVYPCAVVSITAATAATLTPVTLTDANGVFYTGSYNANVFKGAGPLVSSCTNTTPSATGASNDSHTGGGGGFHFHAPIFAKKLDVGATGAYGVGTGRFFSAQLADATLRPDGTMATIHNAAWLGSLEWHVNPKFDIYGYVGGEYAGRAAYTGYVSNVGTTATIPVALTSAGGASIIFPEIQTTWTTKTTGIGGYGSPFANNTGCSGETAPGGTSAPGGGLTCHGDTRYIGEGTLGFWHKLYQGEKGRAQWGIQYSYFYKTGWSGNNNVPTGTSVSPHAVDNMVWTSFRYYLP